MSCVRRKFVQLSDVLFLFNVPVIGVAENKLSRGYGERKPQNAFSEVDHRLHHQQRQKEEPKQSPRAEMDLPSNFTKQTCTPSFEHEGFERRRLEFRKAATKRLGLRLELITIGFHKYYQARVWKIALIDAVRVYLGPTS